MSQTQTKSLDSWMTKLQAAQYLAVAEKTIDRLCARKQIQKSFRKLPGRPPVAIFNPEDLSRIKDTQAQEQRAEPFVLPAANGGQLTVAPQAPAMGLAPILAAIRMAGSAELKEPYFLTLKQAREVSGLPGSYLQEHFIKMGRAIKTGRGWRIARAELETFSRQSSDVSQQVVARV